MPHDLTDAEFLQMAGGENPPAAVEPQPEPILPLTANRVATMGTSGSNRNAPPPLGEREAELARLGARPGVPFHQGLPTWEDIRVKARTTPKEQLQELADAYGAENIRMNELGEPVVKIKGEDYVVDPHKLTLNSLTGLMAYSPEVLASALAIKSGGKDAGMVKQAILGALGGQGASLLKEAGVREASGEDLNIPSLVAKHVGQAGVDTAGGLMLGGAFKAGQIGTDVVKSVADEVANGPGNLIQNTIAGAIKGVPNPLAKSKLLAPANPELTKEGVDAAQRLAAKTGIPANLSPAESTGIPLLAQLEKRQESVPAGAGPMIAAKKARDEVSRAWQNWMTQPDTLGTDEEVARRGIGILRSSVEPLEKDVALAKLAHESAIKGDTELIKAMQAQGEAAQQAKIIRSMNVRSIPSDGVPMTETGDLIRQKVIGARDASYQAATKKYKDFFAQNPEVMDPVIPGTGLKSTIDETLKDLPGVTKLVQQPTGVLGPRGEPIMRESLEKVPINTPIRPQLEELSSKLAGGKISINDLKQVRSDVGEAIKRGEAVEGIKPKRLQKLYAQLSGAIDDGLDQIGDKELKAQWDDINSTFRAHAEKFSDRNLAPLFKEADQPGIGNASFAEKLLSNKDSYNALKNFLGTSSSELAALHTTARNKVLEDSLATGSTTAVDGAKLIRSLESMRKSNPGLYADAFADRGNQLIKEAKILGGFQQNLPGEQLEALLNPVNPPRSTLLSMQVAEKNLAEAYKNGALKDFVQGKSGDLKPDEFIRYLPSYKLSDVKDVMARLESGDPEVAEQVRRKVIEAVFTKARRTETPSDVLASLQGKQGEIVSGSGIKEALGVGDQRAKYQALLGPEHFEMLTDIAKRELLREEKERVGGGAGMLAKGQSVTGLLNALTPGEGGRSSILKDLTTLTRDKIASWILASPQLNSILLTPHTLEQMPRIMGAIVSSEPFVKAALTEIKNPGAAYKVLSTLKSAYGVASPTQRAGGDHSMSDEEFLREANHQ